MDKSPAWITLVPPEDFVMIHDFSLSLWSSMHPLSPIDRYGLCTPFSFAILVSDQDQGIDPDLGFVYITLTFFTPIVRF